MSRRQSYDGVVVTAPFSTPYERYSTQTAHYWLARALKGTLDAAGIAARAAKMVSLTTSTKAGVLTGVLSAAALATASAAAATTTTAATNRAL